MFECESNGQPHPYFTLLSILDNRHASNAQQLLTTTGDEASAVARLMEVFSFYF
jgi:hypothetical protein